MLAAATIVLLVLGGVLPIAALIRAWRVTKRRHEALNDDLSRIHAIAEAHPEPRDATSRMYAVREPTSTGPTVLYANEEIERAILKAAMDDLKGPAGVAAIGVICGMAGSLLSLAL